MENSHGHVFGTDLLHELLKSHDTVQNMEALHHSLVKSFNEFRAEVAFNDDVTFLSLRNTHH
jgi:serine phosphatase RsbU (regulator of sigma subunit)